MKRVKVAIAALGMLCIVPFFMKQIYSNNELQAAGTSFSLYEKVYIANNLYTVIGSDGSNVKLLMDGTTGGPQNRAGADIAIRDYTSAYYLGQLGYEVLSGKIKLPLSSDLAPITSANKLNTNIPAVAGDWWLGDATVNNRSKFMTSDNRDNGAKNLIQTAQDQTTGECGEETKTEYGIMPTTPKKDDDKSIEKLISEKVKVEITTDKTVTVSYNTGDLCNGANFNVTSWNANSTVTGYYVIKDGIIETTSDSSTATSTSIKGNPAILFYNRFYQMERLGHEVNDTFNSVVDGDTCVPLKTPVAIGGFQAASIKIVGGSPTFKVLATVKENTPKNEKVICEGKTQNAGTALARPMATLPTSTILFANTTKRNYASSSTLSDSFPSSDGGTNKPYITLLNPNLKVSLTGGTTYSTEMPTDYILKLPVTLSGNTEGNRYVSASANIGGSLRYGVLKQVNSNSDTVEIDLRQFTDGDPSALSQISLTLYHENEGSFNTSYMGNGTAITVNITQPKTDQEISFTTGNPTSAEYGSLTTIKAQLDTLTAKQSSKDIKFSIVSGNATIDSQSYNSTTGIATASIKPTSGTGDVVIAIDKDGDTTANAATRQTMTITLDKKDITVTPTRFTKTYLLNEAMPALSSTSADVVNGDTLPSILVPVLEPLDDSASSPSTDGVITNIGTWKQVYSANILDTLPSAFSDKYNITLQDWDDDPTYILQTSLDAIPEGWLIVSPDGNDAGWNKGNVTIFLSQEAKNMGYDRIEEVKQTGGEITVVQSGETLVYSSETSSKIPHIRITNKAQTQTSEAMDIRELKIDKTDPKIGRAHV